MHTQKQKNNRRRDIKVPDSKKETITEETITEERLLGIKETRCEVTSLTCDNPDTLAEMAKSAAAAPSETTSEVIPETLPETPSNDLLPFMLETASETILPETPETPETTDAVPPQKVVYSRYPVYGPGPDNKIVNWVDNIAIGTVLPDSVVIYHPDDPEAPKNTEAPEPPKSGMCVIV